MLNLYPTKSVYIQTIKDKFKEKVGKDIQVEKKMKDSYLGDRLELSACLDVKVKYSEVKGSIYEPKTVVEDFIMQSALKFAPDQYISCIFFSLLTSCSTRVETTEKIVKRLEDLQNQLYRTAPEGADIDPQCGLQGDLWPPGHQAGHLEGEDPPGALQKEPR
jgi:methionine synthase II (cobalamin-independent)